MIGSAICLPVSCTGLRAFIAPWKIIEISFQRIFDMPYSVRLVRLRPSKRMSPETMRPFSGRSLSTASAAVVLPQPDSPARPRLSPFSSDEAHVLDGVHPALRELEVGAQVAHLEDALVLDALGGLGGAPASLWRSSVASFVVVHVGPDPVAAALVIDRARRGLAESGHGVVGLLAGV